MTNMQTSEFIRTVDYVSQMNDRWLFLAALCMLLIGCSIVIYWLVRQLNVLLTDHKALRDQHTESLTGIINKYHDTSEKLSAVIQENTSTMRACEMVRNIRKI